MHQSHATIDTIPTRALKRATLAIVGRALGSPAQHNFISDAILPLTVRPTEGRSPASTLSLMLPTGKPSNGT